jgi:adenosine deaminase
VIDYADYLRLLPKAELHCHFVSTMRASKLVELAQRYDVPLRTYDFDQLLDFHGLPEFLDVFNAAHQVLATPEDIAAVAFEGVEDAIAEGNLRYREYFINPDNFRSRFDYTTLIEAIADGLSRAEQRYGVGYKIVVAINRELGPDTATALVREVLANPHPDVVGIGMDDLTPEKTEDPLRFREAYTLAKDGGLKLTAHVGETMTAAEPRNVTDAIDVLEVDRIDHGYRVVDDPSALERAQEAGIPFASTPVSTRVLSGWAFDPDHRIARMIRAGLTVSFSTDDAVFFRSDIGREYVEALPAMGFGPDVAKAVSRAGFSSAFCDEEQKARMLAEAEATHRALDALLDWTTVAPATAELLVD